jgi:hypothetical protein
LENGTASEETVEMAEADLLDRGTILEENPQACPDENLASALKALDVAPRRSLIVAVGVNQVANRIGYVDDLALQTNIVQHPRGWFEVTPQTPYNAVYACKNDTLPNGEPVELIGMRIAGNGLVVDNINSPSGNVYGISHLTRTNMPGSGRETAYDGEKRTYRSYVVVDSLRHYNADPKATTTHIISAIGAEAAQVRFPTYDLLESVMPGWAEDGLIKNVTNPDWQPGMEPVNPVNGEYDILYRDYPAQIRRQVHQAAEVAGVRDVRTDPVLNPADTSSGVIHSSADRARSYQNDEGGQYAGSETDRDLYAVILKPLPSKL